MPLKTVSAIINDPHNPSKCIKVVAEYGIQDSRADFDPYISVTGYIYPVNSAGHVGKEPIVEGLISKEIKLAFPWLSPLLELNLSKVTTGEHLLRPGWYVLSGEPDEGEEPKITDGSRAETARYLRTTPEMLEGITTKAELQELIDTRLKPLWKAQVDSTLALFGFDPID